MYKRQEYIDLIISDIMMPVMEGYELVSELRSAGYQIPVLMITAKSSFNDMRQGFLSGKMCIRDSLSIPFMWIPRKTTESHSAVLIPTEIKQQFCMRMSVSYTHLYFLKKDKYLKIT